MTFLRIWLSEICIQIFGRMRWARSFGVSRASRSANCSASASSLGLGAEYDAFFTVDSTGAEFAGGGLNLTVRDLARFGELIRLDGRYNGQQIVPKTVIDDIRKGGDRALFAPAGYKTLPGWSYRNMWWISHNDHARLHGARHSRVRRSTLIRRLKWSSSGSRHLPLRATSIWTPRLFQPTTRSHGTSWDRADDAGSRVSRRRETTAPSFESDASVVEIGMWKERLQIPTIGIQKRWQIDNSRCTGQKRTTFPSNRSRTSVLIGAAFRFSKQRVRYVSARDRTHDGRRLYLTRDGDIHSSTRQRVPVARGSTTNRKSREGCHSKRLSSSRVNKS